MKPEAEEAWFFLLGRLLRQRPSKARTEMLQALDVIRLELELEKLGGVGK